MPITVTHGWNPVVSGVVSSLVEQYNKTVENEDDRVELLKAQGSDYGNAPKDALSLSPDKQPHGFAGPEFLGPDLYRAVKEGRIVPIERYLDQSQIGRISTLVRGTFSGPDGLMHSMPMNPACGVLFYNEELLHRVNEKIGKDLNFVPRTMEELEEISRALIEHKIAKGGYSCAWPAAYLVEVPAARSDRFIAEPLNGKKGYGTFQLNRDWLAHHLMMLREQIESRIFSYPGLDKQTESKDFFLRGDVCFYMQGSSWFSFLEAQALKATTSFKVGCAALPILIKGQREQGAFPLGGTALYILNNDKTKEKQQAIRNFVQYLASDAFQEAMHIKCASVPVNQDLVAAMEEKGVYEQSPLLKAVVSQTVSRDVLTETSLGIGMPNWDKARAALGDMLYKILTTEKMTKDEIHQILAGYDQEYSVPEVSV